MPVRNVYDDMDEAELVAAVLAGEAAAWPAFFSRYERLIISCVRKVLLRYGAYHSEEDIEDLVSATALNMVKDDYRKLRAFDPTRGYKLSSWIGLLATNTAHDALRQRPPRSVSLEAEEGAGHDVPAEEVDPAERVLREQQARRLEEAVAQLSPTEQLFVRYYFEDELEPEQIAELMQISVNTVYSRKNKVREKLRRIVAADDKGPTTGRSIREDAP